MRILGVDLGDKRVGLAISDPLGFTAQGIETHLVTSKKELLKHLAEICREYKAGEVVVGLPVNMDGSRGAKAQEVEKLLPEMRQALGIPVKTWDERLTSRQAGRLMIQQGLSRQKQKMNSDRMAATLILQGYLETKRSSQLE